LEDFISKVEQASIEHKFNWVHFEGRNVNNAIKQIEWLENKATQEGWRHQLTISVELEKPDREDIDSLLDKGDVVFFSKLFAERRGFKQADDFLKAYAKYCLPQ
jgi:ketohexokinase